MARAQADYLPPAVRDASPQPRFNTAAVVRLAEVPAATFRAWERRYGFPSPSRLPAGQRLYSERDVEAIRWLHEQTERGLTISRAVALLESALIELERPQPEPTRGRPTADLVADLAAALLAADQARANATLEESFALYPLESVALEVIEPVLVDIGERWQRAEVTVAQEHYASQYVLRKLFSLLNAYDSGRGRGLILTACAPGEWHEVGILMVSLFLVRRGHRVHYLGPNLPVDQLASHMARLQPDLVCLSAATAETAMSLIRQGRDLADGGNGRPLVGFGGRAFASDESLVKRAPGQYLGPDARAAEEVVERLLSAEGRR